MTLFEILNFNRELLERLAGTGYKPDDYKYIDLYKEYEQMRRKGEKVTYCVAFLSARHGVSERKVYEILGRLCRSLMMNCRNASSFSVIIHTRRLMLLSKMKWSSTMPLK